MRTRPPSAELTWFVGGLIIVILIVALLVLLFSISPHDVYAQDPTALVVSTSTPASTSSGFRASGSDVTWPAMIGFSLNRLLTFADRWLDKTGGRIVISMKKQLVQIHTDAESPTGPIPRVNGR